MIADIIIAACSVFFVALMIYKTIRRKKNGCCGACKNCSHSCRNECSGSRQENDTGTHKS